MGRGPLKGRVAVSIDEMNLRATEAWRLRGVEGMSALEIASRMAVDLSQVHRYLRRASELIPNAYKERQDTYFEEALAQMDHLIERLAKRVEDSEAQGRLDLAAVKEYRQTVESKRKLLGLDRNKHRLELSAAEGAGGEVAKDAISEIAKLAQRRKQIREIEVPAKEATS